MDLLKVIKSPHCDLWLNAAVKSSLVTSLTSHISLEVPTPLKATANSLVDCQCTLFLSIKNADTNSCCLRILIMNK